jgi:hypothetical protein
MGQAPVRNLNISASLAAAAFLVAGCAGPAVKGLAASSQKLEQDKDAPASPAMFFSLRRSLPTSRRRLPSPACAPTVSTT